MAEIKADVRRLQARGYFGDGTLGPAIAKLRLMV